MSLASRLRTAISLPRAERALALAATRDLVVVRIALALFGFPRVSRALDATRVRRQRGPEFAAAVRRAVERAARTVPGSTCLPQALVAARLLRAGGVPAELTIGVAPADRARRTPVDAHAWVRSGDFVVTGDDELERYTELARTAGRP